VARSSGVYGYVVNLPASDILTAHRADRTEGRMKIASILKVAPRGLVALLFLATNGLAAPDEEALGKADGYPVCPGLARPETRCLVGLVSHFDEVFPARKVARGLQARALKRVATEPAIRYRFQGQDRGLDDYLAGHRTTGLLILRDDTIIAERYQYDRKPEHRMASYSMAKTIIAMLVGIALADGKITSLDDRPDRYVPELTSSPYGETPLRHLLTMSSGVRSPRTTAAMTTCSSSVGSRCSDRAPAAPRR
jgi:CubicO group peptidase (beta-lactamase class C family)